MNRTARSPAQWFAEAVRCYLEAHQGCPCCGNQHCVFRSEWGARVEYYCSACDFSTCEDHQTGRCYAVLGEGNTQPCGVFSVPDLVAALPTR
jgi:hypothetical protein